MADRRTLGQMYGVGIPKNTLVGVRVSMLVEGARYQVGENTRFNSSVTVNALASDTMADVLARVVSFVQSGHIGERAGLPADVLLIEAEITQLFLTGYNNPTISMA